MDYYERIFIDKINTRSLRIGCSFRSLKRLFNGLKRNVQKAVVSWRFNIYNLPEAFRKIWKLWLLLRHVSNTHASNATFTANNKCLMVELLIKHVFEAIVRGIFLLVPFPWISVEFFIYDSITPPDSVAYKLWRCAFNRPGEAVTPRVSR